VIYSDDSHFDLTPVVEIRRPPFTEVSITVLTSKAFHDPEQAIQYGIEIGRERIDNGFPDTQH
jgi:hypothetical protein